jgi:glutaredoxin 2
LDTLAEFYQDYIKKEMASKDDLQQFATKEDLKHFATKNDLRKFATKEDLKKFATKADIEKDLDELESHLMREINGNTKLITNIEVSILDKIKNHEARIKVLEELQPLLTI